MKKEKKQNVDYGNNSISSLKGPDRVRLRPAVIFGSDGIEGCQHAMFEILSNAIDEAREGNGTKINVIRHSDFSVTIEDFGRGAPLDFNEKENRYNYELIFEELYAGGKYNTNQGKNYEYSLGLNGLGCCATQYSSEYMDVKVKRDGYLYQVHFEKGYSIGGLKKEKDSSPGTYTKIKFKPDTEVFTDINITLEFYCDTLKRQAVINKGVSFHLFDEISNSEFSYCYENGIVDYVNELIGDNYISSPHSVSLETKGRDREDKPFYKLKADICFAFSNEANRLEFYHNSSYLEHGGSPEKATKSAFVSAVDSYIKKLGKYYKNEKKISFSDIEDSLLLVINSFSTMTSYENQTKKAITNKFIQQALTDFLKEQLEIYFTENQQEGEKIIDQILVNKHSRESAEKTRMAIKRNLKTTFDPLTRIKKFVDCRTKNPDERELYIVEGDSALGSCKQGRNSDFQAIIPIRGKILNCLKSDSARIFANDIITDIISILGTGVEMNSKHLKDIADFNMDNLRWNKIIICTDADVDGFQIRTLLLTMFYMLTPTLIEKGYIYIAESPLYEISSKNKTYFAYSEKEKEAILSKIKGSYHVQRSKGLGENEPDMMWETTMNPETRRLIQVTEYNPEDTKIAFDTLLGDDLQSRKEYIENFGHLYLEQVDEM
ncbi:DNA gyrase, B subunit, C-terminal domain protein [Filifactor alocis ATCC 35896]|uniref:DNA topoisomerase (ATP-hydrolyzing) n=1 Tax=Filifactor alocis (strain ATCC 35896 / CCUG 47790 / D40 B5) TaxID=546269 RepID=D6GS46_FILAD|nr:toprim domain-containing protein [Filifactor alocis]EFE28487.1 DNA gyrase, B subunit, C-terminal domain protein [Filifactor alocis ATCC 35896]